MLVADGHTIESTGQVGLTHKDEMVEAEFRSLCCEIFGVQPKVIEDRRNGVRVSYITSRNLARFIESLIGKGAYNKVVPDAILSGSAEEKLGFLRGVSLDGYLTGRGLCVYGGMSETCSYHVAEICRSFGLPKVYQGRKAVPERGTYHYVVVSDELQSLVQCVEEHKNIRPVISGYKVLIGAGIAEATHVPTDHPVYSAVRAIRQRGRAYCLSTTASRLGWSIDTPVHRVVSVEDAGLVDMYDIEVAESHAYVVNGMVSHNTINFPTEALVEDVAHSYMLAYREGCKGITIYRDGSREFQVLSHQKSEPKAEEQPAEPKVVEAEWTPRRKRLPDERQSVTHKFQVGEQEGYITVGLYEDGRPGEVFLRVSKQGSTVNGLMESLGQLTSIALQYGVPLDGLASKLKNNRFEPSGMTTNRDIPHATSLVDYLFRWMEKRFIHPDMFVTGFLGGYSNGHTSGNGHGNGAAAVNGTGFGTMFDARDESGVGCPECGSLLHYSEGCMTCRACGYTKCG
jgi:ribonucleoside-diphosphate reductase alpha chain